MQRLLIIFTLLIAGGTVATVFAQGNASTVMSGGDNTVFDESESAFTNPLPLLTDEQLILFEEGDEEFEREWEANEGLGPLFNAVSCEGCHIEDGRGRPPAFTGETGTGFLIRLALNQTGVNGSTIADPIYGGQFQDDSVRRIESEGTIAIEYQEISGTYADGTPYTLYQPVYELTDLNYGAIHSEITMSPRLAGQMIGLGLLEAISDESLIALTDPDDLNGDGISGRVNMVWDVVSNETTIGRFGWKSNQPTLLQQTAGAFNGDMGLTTSLFSGQSCTDAQLCFPPGGNDRNGNRGNNNGRGNRDGNRGNNNGRGNDNGNRGNNNGGDNRNGNRGNNNGGGNNNQLEVSDDILELVTFYSSTLAVPARRNATDPVVIQGQALFDSANCSSCHISTIQTGTHDTIPALSDQTIHPYTDLLLHDMGDGLADGQLDFQASGSEWRTAPLWGIGLLEEVNGYAFYLHDGRAGTLEEAILWHGGEAQASSDAFLNMSVDDRNALIAFLQSL